MIGIPVSGIRWSVVGGWGKTEAGPDRSHGLLILEHGLNRGPQCEHLDYSVLSAFQQTFGKPAGRSRMVLITTKWSRVESQPNLSQKTEDLYTWGQRSLLEYISLQHARYAADVPANPAKVLEVTQRSTLS